MVSMDWLLEKVIRFPKTAALLIVILAAVGATALWWQLVWQNPRRVFENMLADSLATTSVTKTASASSGSQHLLQYARLETGNTNAADWLVTVDQSSAGITTESIGTPTTGFIRYTRISTTEKAANNTPYNFSKVLNVWGKSDGKTDPSLDHLFSQTVLDISNAPLPPIGNLPEAKQQELLAYMRAQQIFTPSYGSVKRAKVAGHSVYTYQVAVKLGAYVRMMQAFAHDMGMNNLDTVDPNQYSTLAPITMTLSVDRASHRLVKAVYAGTGFSQEYTDWGLQTPIAVPRADVTTTELQNRLQALGPSTHV